MPILMFSGDVSSDVFRGYCLKWIKASYKHCKRLKQKFADVLQNSCSYKFRKFDRKTLVLESLLNIVAGLKACNFIKETQTQVFLCEICEFFLRKTFFTDHLRWLLLKRSLLDQNVNATFLTCHGKLFRKYNIFKIKSNIKVRISAFH